MLLKQVTPVWFQWKVSLHSDAAIVVPATAKKIFMYMAELIITAAPVKVWNVLISRSECACKLIPLVRNLLHEMDMHAVAVIGSHMYGGFDSRVGRFTNTLYFF